MNDINRSCRTPAEARMETARDYNANPDEYLQTYPVRINGKKRNIITYKDNEKGIALRQLHRNFAKEITLYYESADNSYAYKKGTGVLQCLEKHMQSNTFLKADIHEFFNSIEYEILYKQILDDNPRKRKKRLETLLKACFYDGHLPIGFITSPVLSDLLLHKVDKQFLQREGVIYTRYADDFIISGRDNTHALEEVKLELKKALFKYGLSLNAKKTYYRLLRQPGDAIHLLGVNLVNNDPEHNRITISDRYIRQTSKDICRFLDGCTTMESEEKNRDRASLYGKVGFIRHFSSSSYKKLEKMISVKRGEKIDLSKALRRKQYG